MNPEPKGAKKKEMFRAEKRRAKAAAKVIGEQKRKEKWAKDHGIAPTTPAPSRNKQHGSAELPADKKRGKASTAAKPKEIPQSNKKPRFDKRPFLKKEGADDEKKATAKEETATDKPQKKFSKKYITSNSDKYFKGDQVLNGPSTENDIEADQMPLNKFIAYAGICGRREAAEMVKLGEVTVNGDVVYEPGYKVSEKDNVALKGNKLFLKKNLVYILLNKPKDFITTSVDPEGRKTVMDLVKEATKERVYPVGRLDRNTTGLLLLTNDGELAQKLTHPGYRIKKIYAVKLDKPITKKDFQSILTGVTLEDGLIQADALAYGEAKDNTELGIEIHSGRNRIVRRIFEHLGYEVKSLDRVTFANLTKKNLKRGNWRMLNEKEVRTLKFMNMSFIKKESEPEMI